MTNCTVVVTVAEAVASVVASHTIRIYIYIQYGDADRMVLPYTLIFAAIVDTV